MNNFGNVLMNGDIVTVSVLVMISRCSKRICEIHCCVFCVLCCVFFVLYCSVTLYYFVLLFHFCVLYCSLFLYCTVSACDVRAATLTEVFQCFFLSCKAYARV
jgi:hypothetical protein